ncbi:DNA polymerase III subunit alpha [bacterium]|nr:DNA polymerase III subunit alpha [bacterium]
METKQNDGRSKFIHLHTHSHYSLLDGLSRIPELVELAKKDEMPAIGLTDHGNLYGAIEFYKTCKNAGIKPIIGVEAYIANRTRRDREPNIDNKRYHLTLLAKNVEGYRNLITLVTKSHLEGFYYKPRMDMELLRTHHEGIICLSGCFGSELSRAIRNKNESEAERVAEEYRDLFGKENYFLEIMHHPGVEGHQDVTDGLIALGRKLKIPVVGTQDSHYAHPEDKKAHETLLSVQSSNSKENKWSFGPDDFSFINTKKAYEYFSDIPEAVENTNIVAEQCDIEIPLGKWVFPAFPLTEKTTHDEELARLAYEGFALHGVAETPEAKTRLDYELSVIKGKGYAVYFLIVADLIRFAREKNIFTAIRGSVAGSLTTYLVGITKVDPLKYKLPFERFLNPERPSAPDIDMDFADDRREEVLDYAKEKYGAHAVAQIGTFGTMLAKGSVRDVARALGHPYGTGDKIANLIPLGSQGFPMTIDRAIKMTPELAELYKTDADTKEIIDLSKKLEGCVRHISVHAAGVVIAPTTLTDFVPVQLDPKGGKVITQYDMHAVEDAGLIKFDFLGIKNLAILGDAVRLIKRIREEIIDIENISLDDKKTFSMLAAGETMGLFQLNGAAITRFLKELRPTSIHDINAMVALYRPGPMEMIPEYIKRKHNPALITHLDPRMKDVLHFSYGVITYQDDVMLIAIKLAGYSWLEADMLRKAMGKKIPAVMQGEKEKLVKGLIKNGMTQPKAEELWKLIEPFAAYGFNKAHAASYGRVAYQTAYLKANFPIEYMTAVLTADSGETEKIAEIINECKRMNIPVLPPDVNESYGKFTVVRNAEGKPEKIRFGLYTIKNLGEAIANAIIAERKEKGAYRSFADFLERVKHKDLNKKSLESLIKCGALDSLGEERGAMLGSVEESLAYHREQAAGGTAQQSLFGLMADTATVPALRLKSVEPAPQTDKLSWEKELLGLYISGHPLDKYREKLEARKADIKDAKNKLKDGMALIIAGIIEESKEINTKKGERMAFLKIRDLEDSIEAVCFPSVYQEMRGLITLDKCIAIKGRYSERNGSPSVIIEAIKEL